MPPMMDNYLVIYQLIQVVNQKYHCGVYPQMNAGLRSNYPFITYDWVDPGSDVTLDETDVMEVRLQIDVQATDMYEALNTANDLRKTLAHSYGYRGFFKQAHVIPHNVSGTSSRNFYNGTQLPVYRFGFDCSFSIYRAGTIYKPEDLNFEFNETTIESIKAMNQMTGKEINVRKEEL
ncbi:hypothetical protein HYQ53_1777 [Lactobacillus crispatus]|nr:hypothetical protein [Lactobacillus crispatus]MBI1717939.1 hypothetical protein [Lactobacillus crispatus]